MNRYSKIPDGSLFITNSGKSYKKINDLLYEDPETGYETAWSPIFDSTIIIDQIIVNSPSQPFIIDPQSRVIKPNPDYVKDEDQCSRFLRIINDLVSALEGVSKRNCWCPEQANDCDSIKCKNARAALNLAKKEKMKGI